MRLKTSLNFTIYTTLICFMLTLTACKDDKPSKPFNLKLGTPGNTEVKNDIPKNDRVHPLEDNENIEFTSDDGKAIVTHNSNRKLEKDDILIGNKDQKYLVRIKEIIKKDNNKTEVILRQSRIGEVVGDNTGSVDIESTPMFFPKDLNKLNHKAKRDSKFSKSKEKPSYDVDDNGKITIKNLELFSFNLNKDGKVSGGLNKVMGIIVKDPYEKFSLSGSAGGQYKATINEAIIEVIPTLRSNSKWKLGKINNLETRFDTKVKYRVDITYDLAGKVSLEGLIDFLPKKVIPIRVGTPPVYLDIELGIPAGIKVSTEKSGKTRIVYETEYEFYSTMTYKSGQKVKTTKNQKVLINETRIDTKNSSTKLDAELFLKPQVTARLYRVVGPYAYLKPYVRGEIEWPANEKKDDLFVGVTGGVGIELSEPIFLNNIVSYDSGDIFNFYKSFDLDKKGQKPTPVEYGDPGQSDVNVDTIGPEGFVSINLKERAGQEDLRFELVEPTQTGLLVPSENFYFSGQLYYYPLSHSKPENFKVKLIGRNGKSQVTDLSLSLSRDVIDEASKDRFSMTSNSYKVTTGKADNFAASVPRHDVAVGINTISQATIHITEHEPNLCHHATLEIKNLMNTYGIPCQELLSIKASYRDSVSNKSFVNKVNNLINDSRSTSFTYLNQYNFKDYMFMLNQKRANCKPIIKVEMINKLNKDEKSYDFGLKFIERTCGVVDPKINADNLKSLRLFGISADELIIDSSFDTYSRIHTVIIPHKTMIQHRESLVQYTSKRSPEVLLMYLPETVQKNQIKLTSQTRLSYGGVTNREALNKFFADHEIGLTYDSEKGVSVKSESLYKGSYLSHKLILDYKEGDFGDYFKIQSLGAEEHKVEKKEEKKESNYSQPSYGV